MATLARYLPARLSRSLSRLSRFPDGAWGEPYRAALLLSDVTGFTSLTESLESRGRVGAEEIAEIISGVFQPAIRAVRAEGGSIACFGGDSLLSVFTGAGAVRAARDTSERILDAFRREPEVPTPSGAVELRVRQAIHVGTVRDLHLGTSSRRHLLTVGRPLQTLVRLAARTPPNRVRFTPAARREVARRRARRRTVPRVAPSILRPYLPAPLLPLLGRFDGAYRRASILFLQTESGSRRTLDSFYRELTRVLDRYGGVLLKTDAAALGVTWLCMFGIPRQHEDDAERAARAALDVRDAMAARVPMRGGLHAGTLVAVEIGTRSRRSFEVMGDVVNTAARVMTTARPGEILTTDAFSRTVPAVRTKARGRHRVKGKAVDLALRRVLRVASARRRLRVQAPVLGREKELERIVGLLKKAREGGGSALVLRGEAGIGKSRLKHEAARRARRLGFDVHEGWSAGFGDKIYGVVASLCRDLLAVPSPATSAQVRDRISSRASALPSLDRHHLAEVMGARSPDSPVSHQDPKTARLNNAMAVTALIASRSRERPQLLLFEDLHLADEASLDVLRHAVRKVARVPVVMLLLGRPNLPDLPEADALELSELPGDAVNGMVDALLGDATPKVRDLVLQRAAGNPFYVEELVRHLRDATSPSDGSELDPENLPHSVDALLKVRLDRLSVSAQRSVQVASVAGRSVPLELWMRLLDDAAASRSMEELTTADIVVEVVRDGNRELVFRQALVRDVAYGSMLRSRRRALHRRMAREMEQMYRGELEPWLAAVAHHWDLAGEAARALPHYLAAARWACDRFAHDEAERCYRRYLKLVDQPSRDSVLVRAEFCSRVLEVRFEILEGLREARRALAQATALGDPGLEGTCLDVLGWFHHHAGRTDAAQAAYESALRLCSKAGDKKGAAHVLSNLAILLQNRGRLDEAEPRYEEALALLREQDDQLGEAQCLGNIATLYMDRGQLDEARALMQKVRAMLEEAGQPDAGVHVGNLANVYHQQGDQAEAGRLYEVALELHRKTGRRASVGHIQLSRAVLFEDQGQLERALAAVDEGLAVLRELGNRPWVGYALGLKARFLVEAGQLEAAQDLLEESLRVTREVQEKADEGLAVTGLSRLLRYRGEYEEALRLNRHAQDLIGNANVYWLLDAVMEEGHIHLASGRSGAEALERACALAGWKRGEEEKDAGIAGLHLAQLRFEQGAPLVRGECPDRISSGVRDWLRHAGAPLEEVPP